jgi:hypothetical protein
MRRKTLSRRAIASVLAILMLAILFTLAVSFAGLSGQSNLQAANLARAETARMQAESGVSFVVQKLSSVTPPPGATGSTLLGAVATSLGTQLNGTPNLRGATVTNSGGTVTIPTIFTDGNSRGFRAAITVESNTIIRVNIVGIADANGVVSRTIQICCNPTTTVSPVFSYGVAARGPISLTGNASLRGANNRQEASLLTTASIVGNEVGLNGNCTVDGDVSVGPPDGNVGVVGNISIGGATGAAIWNHVDLGVGDVPFPSIDPNVFAPFATNLVTSATGTTGNKTFTNIRIKAGTNPTFSGNIIIKGVVFIETPNVVRFAGNLNFTGVMVTQDAGSGNTAGNAIHFAGNTTSAGVESLPDTPEFHDLRQVPGTFLLAPGFETEFVGNFGTVNGTMAAEKFTWTGNAGGVVNGSVLSYGPGTMSLTGNSQITINRSRYSGTPPGFGGNAKLVPNMDSYQE